MSNFKTYVWKILQPEINKPLTAQKLHTLDLLITVHNRYPTVLPLEQLQSILWRNQPPQYEELFNFYLKAPTLLKYTTYILGKFLAKCSNEQALEAWLKHVIEKLPSNNIVEKSCFISTLTNIIVYMDENKPESRVQLKSIFAAEPLVTMLVEELRAMKKYDNKKKGGDAKDKMRFICRQFEAAIILCFDQIFKQDDSKLQILRPLLEQQLNLDMIAQTPKLTQTLFTKLSAEGLDQMYDFYFENFTSNNEKLTPSDREHCLKQMQNLMHSKRNQQLRFLLNASVFHLDDQLKKCTAGDAAIFSRQAASRCEESLFNCLVHKLGVNKEQLEDLNQVLRTLLLPFSRKLFKSSNESKLRIKLTPELRKTWEKVQTVVESDPIKETEIKAYGLIFDTLIMFIGIATLMPNSNMELDIIDDLLICKENAIKSKSQANESSVSVLTAAVNSGRAVSSADLIEHCSNSSSYFSLGLRIGALMAVGRNRGFDSIIAPNGQLLASINQVRRRHIDPSLEQG